LNRSIGMFSSIINAVSVFLFALSMIISFDYLSYLSSLFIAFSFIPMVCTYVLYSKIDKKVAGYTALAFSVVYVTMIQIIYFAQLTTVHQGGLTADASAILDYQNFGLFFNYNLLGYGMMALSTFFIGLTIEKTTKLLSWLKHLLLIHGIFFISGLIIPLLGIFNSDMQGSDVIGTLVLLIWCIYFIPIGILSFIYFKDKIIMDCIG